MKKIVMGIAALACAASMFAVDMSAALKFNGSFFDMTFADGAKPTALKLDTPSGRKPWGQTGIDLNVTADKAGATINIDSTCTSVGYKMWLQPADFLKINLGDLDYCLNKESIDYAGCINSTGSNGAAFDLTFGGLTANLILNPGYGNSWFNGDVPGNTAVMVKYGADFGTVGFAWIGASEGTNVYSSDTLSLGYSGNFGPVSLFSDVSLIVKPYETKALTNVKADLFVKANVSALTAVAYADMNYDLTATTKPVAVGAKAKVSYALGAVTPYVYLKDANVLADTFAMTVKPGVTFNCGAAGVEVAADFTISAATGASKVSVPFSVALNF